MRVGHKGGRSEKLCSCSSGEDAVARWNTGTASCSERLTFRRASAKISDPNADGKF